MRHISSYSKIQHLIGAFLRNQRFQLRKKKIHSTRYLDLGCGLNCNTALINLDYSWHPKVDLCWDIKTGIPFPAGSLKGVFTEHCLEHFPLKKALFLLSECKRVLLPKGIVRVVVPDAGMYLQRYYQRSEGISQERFPFEDRESFLGIYTPILSVNRIYYQDREQPFGHQTMFDFPLLKELLLRAGFLNVQKTSFRNGSDPTLLVDSEGRSSESLYVEAS